MKNNGSKYTILFVEDDKIALQSYSASLRESFKHVYEAEDGQNAYTIYKEKRPDIMIIDVDIPKLNGIELLKKIRKTDLNTKAILFTSYSDTETFLNASSLKLTKYLIKPVARKDFFEALNFAIEEIQSFSIVSNKVLKLKDNFSWNIKTGILSHLGNEISLTKTERSIFTIIVNLCQSKGIITYEEIIDSLWDYEYSNPLQSLKKFMSNLRKKLPKDTILNEYNLGYKISVK